MCPFIRLNPLFTHRLEASSFLAPKPTRLLQEAEHNPVVSENQASQTPEPLLSSKNMTQLDFIADIRPQ